MKASSVMNQASEVSQTSNASQGRQDNTTMSGAGFR